MEPIPSEYASVEVARFLINGQFKFRNLHEASALAEFLGKICPNPRMSILGLSEIFMNAIEHGNLGIGTEEKIQLQKENQWIPEIERRLKQPKYIDHYVNVKVTQTKTDMQISVQDSGKGFDWKALRNLNTENHLSTQGRGILMAENLGFKSLEYSEKGNEVTCIISLI